MAWRAATYAALDHDTFAEGSEARYSAAYCLIVVGEALNNVPAEVRALAPEIEWRAVIDMRHVLVHAYWRTDYAVVHEVLRRDLGPLIEAIDRLLPLIEGK
ncbi:MAG: DUF86 domain-containing protein [Xanthobacteraceae bacterium]|nr:DUF86 domain-containing protein [Xanthobacteraceae bacterium]